MPQGGGSFMLIIYLIAMVAIMYFIMIRPQRKREKETRQMLSALQVGYNVVTIGGVIGKVVNIKDDEITIETGVVKTQVKVKKWAIKEVEKLVEA